LHVALTVTYKNEWSQILKERMRKGRRLLAAMVPGTFQV